MKNQVNRDTSGEPRTRGRVLVLLLSGILLTPLSIDAGAGDSYQHNALFNPSQSQLKAETRGRVMIYDGLDNATVERAMDDQFERVQHMSFIRARFLQADGEVSIEDDDCD